MPNYSYTARDDRGNLSAGSIDATSSTTAARILQGQGLFVVNLTAASSRGEAGSAAAKKRRHRRIKSSDLLFFIRQTGTLLNAGIPLLRSIEIISAQCESEKLSVVLEKIRSDIRSGATFKSAIMKHPKVFPPIWAYLIEAGETSGDLTLILDQLADNLELTMSLRQKVITAFVYPSVLIIASITAISVFVLFVIPVFSKLYESFHAKLPVLTQSVIDSSLFLRRYILFLLGGVLALVHILKKYISTTTGHRQFDALCLRLPLFGAFITDAIIARITINLATLIRSGVDLLKCIEITSRVSGNTLFEAALTSALADVRQGKTLSSSLGASPLFPPIMIHMLTIGEESGKLPDMMASVAKEYEAKVNIFINRLGVLVEPIVLILVGAVVGVLVVSLFLPIFSLSSVIH